MLEACNIDYSVGAKKIISECSVTFKAGSLNLIVGPNGAGKSTLVKLLSGFLAPQFGQIKFEGINISALGAAELARRRAVLSQAVEIAFPLTVREVVMMGRYPHFGGRPRPADEIIVEEMMQFFDVAQFRARNYQTLSGGERQRVNFARVLGQLWQLKSDPETPVQSSIKYLFLDEPLTFLDIRHQIDFMKKIKNFAAAPDVVTVGVVHDLNLAVRFADQIVVLDDGKLIGCAAPQKILTPELIRRIFHVESKFFEDANSGIHLILE